MTVTNCKRKVQSVQSILGTEAPFCAHETVKRSKNAPPTRTKLLKSTKKITTHDTNHTEDGAMEVYPYQRCLTGAAERVDVGRPKPLSSEDIDQPPGLMVTPWGFIYGISLNYTVHILINTQTGALGGLEGMVCGEAPYWGELPAPFYPSHNLLLLLLISTCKCWVFI